MKKRTRKKTGVNKPFGIRLKPEEVGRLDDLCAHHLLPRPVIMRMALNLLYNMTPKAKRLPASGSVLSDD
jgi:hypothetical protein